MRRWCDESCVPHDASALMLPEEWAALEGIELIEFMEELY